MIAYYRVFDRAQEGKTSKRKMVFETRWRPQGGIYVSDDCIPEEGFHELHFIDTGRYQLVPSMGGYAHYGTGNISDHYFRDDTRNPGLYAPELSHAEIVGNDDPEMEQALSVPLLWDSITFGSVDQKRKDGYFLDTKKLFLFHVPMGDKKPQGTDYMELSRDLYTELKEGEILSVAMQTRDLYGESEHLESWISEKNKLRGAERIGVQEIVRNQYWGPAEPKVKQVPDKPKPEVELRDEDVL